MNKVLITGFISKNLKVETTSTGRERIQFDIATRRDFKSSDGKYKYDFPHVQSWNPGINKFIKAFCDEGAHVEIEGRWQTDTYTGKDNKKKKIDYINLEALRCLDRKSPIKSGKSAPASGDFASMGQSVDGEGDCLDVENLDW